MATLPPKERACVLLKDVFDYSLEEIAELVDSTVGGVKAALNRARTKLAVSSPSAKSARSVSPELKQIMRLYVDRFNRRDWEGVRELTSADARLNVLERFAGKFADAAYLFNYERWPWPWRLALGEVDGEIGGDYPPPGCGYMVAPFSHPVHSGQRTDRTHRGLHPLSVGAFRREFRLSRQIGFVGGICGSLIRSSCGPQLRRSSFPWKARSQKQAVLKTVSNTRFLASEPTLGEHRRWSQSGHRTGATLQS